MTTDPRKVEECNFELGETVYFINDWDTSPKSDYVPSYYITCRIYAIHLTEAEKRSHITLKSDSWLPSLSKQIPLYKADKWVFKTPEGAVKRLKELEENAKLKR